MIFKTFDDSFDIFEKIELSENANYIDAFNTLKELCETNDIIVLASPGCYIRKSIDIFCEKLLNSDCQVGGCFESNANIHFKRFEEDTILTEFNIVNFNFILINCREFKNLEIPQDLEFSEEIDFYKQLSMAVSVVLSKYYIFPKLFLNSDSLPCTLNFMDSFVVKFEPIDDPHLTFTSDIFLDEIYTENELIEKRHYFPLNCLILYIKQEIIKKLFMEETCTIELI